MHFSKCCFWFSFDFFFFFNFHFFFSFFNFGFLLFLVLRTTALELLWWRNISFFRNSLIFSLNFFSNSSWFENWRIFLCIFALLLYIKHTIKPKDSSPINKEVNEQILANALKRKIQVWEAYKIRLVTSWALSKSFSDVHTSGSRRYRIFFYLFFKEKSN